MGPRTFCTSAPPGGGLCSGRDGQKNWISGWFRARAEVGSGSGVKKRTENIKIVFSGPVQKNVKSIEKRYGSASPLWAPLGLAEAPVERC